MWRKFLTFVRLPFSEKAAVFEALAWLGLGRFLVLTQPFARLSPWLGTAGLVTPVEEFSPELSRSIGVVARAITRIQPYTPWDSNCLAQAFAARQMLQRRRIPSTIYLGAMLKERSDLIAHAWLRSGKWILTGGVVHKKYGVVATFGNDPAENK